MAQSKIKKFGIIGGSMFMFSIVFQSILFPTVLKFMVKRKVALKQGWMMREVWGKFPFAFEFQFYLFNVTNPDEIKAGEKPRLQEVGPFVYDEWQEKTNQIDHDEDDTVSYTLRNTYYFNAEKSNGLTGDEELVLPNVFALGLLNTVKRERPSAVPIVGKAIDSILNKPTNLFMKVKVRDILFDGILIDCSEVKDFAGSAVCGEIAANYEDLRLKLAGENQYLMSLWGSMNATDAKGRTRVLRGLKKLMDVGKVVEFDNKFNISVWDDEYCDAFNGTDGTVFHPFFDKHGKDDIVAFNPGLCRSVSCYYTEKSKYAGMNLLRYTTDLGTDGENIERHKCYCETPDNCVRKGAYDVYKCAKAPLLITNPHFYLADPWYLEHVEGLKPEKDKHMVIIDLDPFTGSPIHVHTRAQFNIYINKVEKIKILKTYPEAVLPIMWFDEIIILPDYLLKEIKMGHMQVKLAKVFKHFMMFGGLGVLAYTGFLYYKENHMDKKSNVKTTVQSNGNSGTANGTEKKINISTIQAAQVPPNVVD